MTIAAIKSPTKVNFVTHNIELRQHQLCKPSQVTFTYGGSPFESRSCLSSPQSYGSSVSRALPSYMSAYSSVLHPWTDGDIAVRKGEAVLFEVVLEDANGAIWDELERIRKDFESTKSTRYMLLRMMEFMVRHDKRSVHEYKSIVAYPWSDDVLHRTCDRAEFKLDEIRMASHTKWWCPSKTVLVRLIASVDENIYLHDLKKHLLQHRDDCVEHLIRDVCKNNSVSIYLSSLVCMQPRIFLYATAKGNFCGSTEPDPIVLSAI